MKIALLGAESTGKALLTAKVTSIFHIGMHLGQTVATGSGPQEGDMQVLRQAVETLSQYAHISLYGCPYENHD